MKLITTLLTVLIIPTLSQSVFAQSSKAKKATELAHYQGDDDPMKMDHEVDGKYCGDCKINLNPVRVFNKTRQRGADAPGPRAPDDGVK